MKSSVLAPLLLAVSTALVAGRAGATDPAAAAEAAMPNGLAVEVPAGWKVRRAADAVTLLAPEAGTAISFVGVAAEDSDGALAAAWRVLGREPGSLVGATDEPVRMGWEAARRYAYRSAAGSAHATFARTLRAGGRWTVLIAELDDAVADKRSAQLRPLLDGLRAPGWQPETFAGKQARPLDAAALARVHGFVESARRALDIPGVAYGIVRDGQVVVAEGLGVRDVDLDAPVDADTAFMIASSTKSLTTLMLAKLVDAGRFDWETPVTTVDPAFRLGDADATRKMHMRHLVCACTGLPRNDLQFLFEGDSITPESTIADLARTRPTSGFGELFQYSNSLAAAGGYVGARALYPALPAGDAYDAAMQALVFDPLGMRSTTFDYARAMRGNHASPHGRGLDGRTARIDMGINRSPIGVRPAGAAWSTLSDMLRYVGMETTGGVLPNGSRYIGEAALLGRRTPQVSMGGDADYGIGLMIDRSSGATVVHHGGDLIGYHGDMFWLPEHGVGAVLLTNADSGVMLRGPFRRFLLETLFDGVPEAAERVSAAVGRLAQAASGDGSALQAPAERSLVEALAPRYRSDALGDLRVSQRNGQTWFDFGAWATPVASRRDADGRPVLVTVGAGVNGLFEFEVGEDAGRRTLTVRNGQDVQSFRELEG